MRQKHTGVQLITISVSKKKKRSRDNKDYDPFIRLRRLNVQSYLDNDIFKGFYFQTNFHVDDFKARAVLSASLGNFNWIHKKKSVLGMTVI